MYLIVGLGNPEDDYAGTRHNMGFDTLNKIAKQYDIEINKKKFDGLFGKGKIEDQEVVLLKPQTYMNLSGQSVKQALDFYKIDLDNLIIIYDDIDIEKGIVKLRKQGGAGTHNGMKSVIECLGSEKFPRVRIGIGMPEYEGQDLVSYVIGYVPDEEKELLDKGCEIAKDAVIEILENGIDIAMNKTN